MSCSCPRRLFFKMTDVVERGKEDFWAARASRMSLRLIKADHKGRAWFVAGTDVDRSPWSRSMQVSGSEPRTPVERSTANTDTGARHDLASSLQGRGGWRVAEVHIKRLIRYAFTFNITQNLQGCSRSILHRLQTPHPTPQQGGGDNNSRSYTFMGNG